jgi:hypothetical protein
MDWQPIETAPRDGTVFLAAYKLGHGPWVGVMQWQFFSEKKDDGRFYSWTQLTETHKATHWMPLPEPPEGPKTGEL